ncbi:MAG: hypothetical protein AAB962_03200 [Patescibacteria group bacterium]
MSNKIGVCLIGKKRREEGGTEKAEGKVDIQLEVPSYMERFILNDIKDDLRIALINKGYEGNYKLNQYPKITITIE